MSFKDNLRTAVFTTKFVIDESSPILFVYHDEDGSWQFHGKEDNIKEADMRIVGLGEILEIDNSIWDLKDMSPGFEAFRSSKVSEWKVVSGNEN